MTTVQDNPELHRYELFQDGELAALAEYRLHGSVADFVHTETADRFGGQGLATELIREALDDARRRGWQVRPFCPFVRQFIADHHEYRDLVPRSEQARFFGSA